MANLKKRAAARPAPRTIPISLDGDYAGWEATARADFPSRLLYDLSSNDEARMYGALNKIVIEHNFPDDSGEIAGSLEDVDWAAITKLMEGISKGIADLPNR